MKKILITLFVFSIMVTLFITRENSENTSIEKDIDNHSALIAENLNKVISLRTSTSSNPYDYIKDNNEFDEIINLGNDALPYLHKKLSESKNSGLQDYITAIAIETIARVDLKKNPSTFWETSDGFNKVWKKHLASIPLTVNKMAADSQLSSAEKTIKLLDLGTPAIPFILAKIESGNEDLFSAVIELTKGSKVEATHDVINKKEWAIKHQDSFKNLKKYVWDQQ